MEVPNTLVGGEMDIVERLRHNATSVADSRYVAADEIECLRAELEKERERGDRLQRVIRAVRPDNLIVVAEFFEAFFPLCNRIDGAQYDLRYWASLMRSVLEDEP